MILGAAFRPLIGWKLSDARVRRSSSSSVRSRSAAAALASSWLTLHQAVAHLVAEHGAAVSPLGRLPLREREVADADVANDALLLKAAHAFHLVADGHDRVRLVDLVQIDRLDAQPPGTGPAPLL